MQLAKWDDGYVFDADPRREDPLYYYMRDGGWGSAIGIEVAPLYEEHTASRVTIRVWPEHLPREAGLEAAVKRDMYSRVLSVLLRRYPKWSSVTLQSNHIPELAEHGLISSAFMEAGFSRSMFTTHEETWTKAPPCAAANSA
ncbi:hypothetical protein [Prosthecobacter sp.]|uniref:hypothetical protein n=1 Tax=Prosthecobacter sp. TaxID=1965333 RepID=UPI003784D903